MSTSLCLTRRAETMLLYKPVIYRVSRLALLLILALIASSAAAPGQQVSPSPEKPKPSPTPIPLTTVALESQSAMASLQAIDTNLEESHSSAGVAAGRLPDLPLETAA